MADHDVAPPGVAVESQVDVVLEGDGEPEHEGGARGDDIAVPRALTALLWNPDALLLKLRPEPGLLCFLNYKHRPT